MAPTRRRLHGDPRVLPRAADAQPAAQAAAAGDRAENCTVQVERGMRDALVVVAFALLWGGCVWGIGWR